MTRTYNQICPVAQTLDIIGDRWTLLIIRDLFLGRTKFKEFGATSPGLPAKVLSDRLKKLEQHGLIQRVVYSQHPLRAEYRLSEKGLTLRPVLEAIARWGMEHRLEPEARAAVASRIYGESESA